jgi:hypothetical protein
MTKWKVYKRYINKCNDCGYKILRNEGIMDIWICGLSEKEIMRKHRKEYVGRIDIPPFCELEDDEIK